LKKQVKLFFDKSIDSLILSIEHFNRPWDKGRQEAVLILLDRAFELLLKAVILHRGGKIRDPYEKQNISFEKCVRKCISDKKIKCLEKDQALTIQIINSFRDAAQHDIVKLSEQDLYLYSQAGVTLFKDILSDVFDEDLKNYMPERVLPISTQPPRDLHAMIDADFALIKNLVKPKSRRLIDAKTRLKALAIVEASLEGIRSQPSDFEINKLIKEVRFGKMWQQIFPGIASLQLSTEGNGINVEIRITKREGEKVHLVPEGTPGATILAVKRVNELDYYSLSRNDLASKIGLTGPKTTALIDHLKLQENPDYFKIIKIKSSEFKRYSPKALDILKKQLPKVDMDKIWEKYKKKKKRTN